MGRFNIEDFVTANGVLYTLLEQELKPAVDSAVEKSGNLFGDNLQDSRINNAARGDGLAVIETWIFSLERFGDCRLHACTRAGIHLARGRSLYAKKELQGS